MGALQTALTIAPSATVLPQLGRVYCFLCTRTVLAELVVRAHSLPGQTKLTPANGQICPRCSATLDAAFVVEGPR